MGKNKIIDIITSSWYWMSVVGGTIIGIIIGFVIIQLFIIITNG